MHTVDYSVKTGVVVVNTSIVHESFEPKFSRMARLQTDSLKLGVIPQMDLINDCEEKTRVTFSVEGSTRSAMPTSICQGSRLMALV